MRPRPSTVLKSSVLTRPRVVFALRSATTLSTEGDRHLARLLCLAYGALGALGFTLAYFFAGKQPLMHPAPWLSLPPVAAASASIALGVAVAFAVVTATRYTVVRFAWARRLHVELRPVAKRFDRRETWLVAILSSVGEELFFRSFLVSTIGLVGATVLFGFLHQVRGPSRWVWVLWAGMVGLVLGLIFIVTGSVLGPIVAHALINGTNLGFLKNYEVDEIEPAR